MSDAVLDKVIGGSLVVRDHGGARPPILLLHGLGGNLLTWEPIVGLLADRYRVVTVDLRGHGASDDAAWDWDAVLDDLEAVIGALGLHRPAVVGHSLGGMVAACWARRHPDCPAAISLDGHRSAATDPEHYADIEPAELTEALAELNAIFDAQFAGMGRQLTAAQADELVRAQRAAAEAMGWPVQMVVDSHLRSLRAQDDGFVSKPSAELAGTVRRSPEFRDALPVLRAVRSPFLLVLAGRNMPGLPANLARLADAHRSGLRRDLALPSAENPAFRVLEIDAGHGMVLENPVLVADLVVDFLTEQRFGDRTPNTGR
ncbi:putative hydrolase or acyltransferase of alpha/beta superfamily [Actinoalloteichus hymeniacidonis]|uniref:Hydrolase or acyltransferase of alpha/beta superfamily n=2 Tax=Actinoalloteichus hymeniacidonis TaxID=340345 RepID=A0AAC9N0S8_9PSEU|nr:putative hydrolase or acyltransferase of alpha/beta superfamily [Actinoalloteichus hymeniacidonis]